MNEEANALARVLRKDPRYAPDAYFFVREALSFAADSLELRNCNCRELSDDHSSGTESCGQKDLAVNHFSDFSGADFSGADFSGADLPGPGSQEVREECHVTGQQLCDGIRQYALAQFGLMSKVVLNSWGIHSTSDFGEIVYNLIKVGVLKKSPRDRRSHFDGVYDFDEAFASENAVTAAFPSKLASLR